MCQAHGLSKHYKSERSCIALLLPFIMASYEDHSPLRVYHRVGTPCTSPDDRCLLRRYNGNEATGVLRHLTIRRGSRPSGAPEYMVIVTTTETATQEQLQPLAAGAQAAGGGAAVSVQHSVALAGRHKSEISVSSRPSSAGFPGPRSYANRRAVYVGTMPPSSCCCP